MIYHILIKFISIFDLIFNGLSRMLVLSDFLKKKIFMLNGESVFISRIFGFGEILCCVIGCLCRFEAGTGLLGTIYALFLHRDPYVCLHQPSSTMDNTFRTYTLAFTIKTKIKNLLIIMLHTILLIRNTMELIIRLN